MRKKRTLDYAKESFRNRHDNGEERTSLLVVATAGESPPDVWETIWVVSKVFSKAEKAKVRMKVEIKSGLLELVIADFAEKVLENTIPAVIGAVVTYILMRRAEGKKVEIVRFNPEVQRSCAYYNLIRVLEKKFKDYEVVSERWINKSFELIIADKRGKHRCLVSQDLKFHYQKL